MINLSEEEETANICKWVEGKEEEDEKAEKVVQQYDGARGWNKAGKKLEAQLSLKYKKKW